MSNREKAKEKGELTYAPEKPCKKGHLERYTNCGMCIECQKQYKIENAEKIRLSRKEYSEKNREKIRLRQQSYVKKHNEKIKEQSAKYREENKEKLLEQNRQWNRENAERLKQKRKIWLEENREKVRMFKRSREARKKGAEGKFTLEDIQNIFIQQNGVCVYCKKDLSDGVYHIDHILPLVLGGSNWPQNLQVLCISCNSSKGGKHPDEWEEYRKKFRCDKVEGK